MCLFKNHDTRWARMAAGTIARYVSAISTHFRGGPLLNKRKDWLVQIKPKIKNYPIISILTMPKYTSQVSHKQINIPNECFIGKPFMDFNCKTLPTKIF